MPLKRREFFKSAAGLCASPVLLTLPAARAWAEGAGADAAAAPPVSANFPARDPEVVREMVAVSHGNLARVKELLDLSPALAKATWDWGFGDWETALGAASHVGNREIAGLLMEHGARPDMFTFAMLGHLDVVKAYVAAHPGIQKTHGPHGLTMLHHARKGGDGAQAVRAYLEGLGDADIGYATKELTDAEKAGYLGDYSFGPGPDDRLTVSLNKDGALGIKRLPDGATRNLFSLGNHQFHPPGNSTVRITFDMAGGKARGLAISEGGQVVTASRLAG